MPLPAPFVCQRVRFILPDGPSKGQVRPAVVVKVHDSTDPDVVLRVNLVVTTNFHDDELPAVMWVQRVGYDSNEIAPGTWHPEPAAAAPTPA